MTNANIASTIWFMNSIDLSFILNSLASPVAAVKPIFNSSEKITDFEILYTNDAFNKEINISKEEKESKNHLKKFAPNFPWIEIAEKLAEGKKVETVTHYFPEINKHLKLSFSSSDKDFFVLTLERINERESELNSDYDSLTGLRSRSKFNNDYEVLLKKAQENKTLLPLLLIDIDNMKHINDSQGHSIGDEVLLNSTTILKRFESAGLLAYRYGDDEFMVVIPNQTSMNSVINITDAIFEAFMIEQISVSGGITVFPENSADKDDLLKFTDIAISYAKKEGKNKFEFFKPDMQRIFIQKLNMQTKMSAAVLREAFTLVYQPQFDIKSGILRGFEALIRWTDEDLGAVSPSVFIPVAEETGLIISISNWVLNTAFYTLKKWQDTYDFAGIISVNISPIHLKHDCFITDILELVKMHELSPNSIEIEITEGIMIDNMESTVNKLRQLKEFGFRISLDDFGTGYSSLSYLQMLPLSTLKIDKSFIRDITAKDGIQANITNSIINMVSNMGLDTIAEGVEKPDQLDMLKKFDCHIVQGFLRGKPMPVENCNEYLSGNHSALISLEK